MLHKITFRCHRHLHPSLNISLCCTFSKFLSKLNIICALMILCFMGYCLPDPLLRRTGVFNWSVMEVSFYMLLKSVVLCWASNSLMDTLPFPLPSYIGVTSLPLPYFVFLGALPHIHLGKSNTDGCLGPGQLCASISGMYKGLCFKDQWLMDHHIPCLVCLFVFCLSSLFSWWLLPPCLSVWTTLVACAGVLCCVSFITYSVLSVIYQLTFNQTGQ